MYFTKSEMKDIMKGLSNQYFEQVQLRPTEV